MTAQFQPFGNMPIPRIQAPQQQGGQMPESAMLIAGLLRFAQGAAKSGLFSGGIQGGAYAENRAPRAMAFFGEEPFVAPKPRTTKSRKQNIPVVAQTPTCGPTG